jgi:Methyltransferase domain
MECLICKSKTEYFFSKKYEEEPFATFMKEIGVVEYYKCTNCGFTVSKTHGELSTAQWEKLNFDFHDDQEKNIKLRQINQPPYLEQGMMINILAVNGVIDTLDMLDFAGGHGTLSNVLGKYFDIHLPVYDPFMQNSERKIYVAKENLKKYKVVINSAVFEHIVTMEDLDEINNCVADDGCMILHTVVCENIPNDPDWFYFKPPVHCAFHTNKSMEILMKKWNYKSSVYCAKSKCWILFKKDLEIGDIKGKVELINSEFQEIYLVYKAGFVDYWKGF